MVIAVAILSASCASVQPPKVVLTGVQVTGLSVDGLELKLLADVTNPNDFGARIKELDYRVLLDGDRLAEGILPEDVDVSAGGTVEVGIPLTLTWEGIGDTIEKAIDGKKHDWKLAGSATLGNGMLSRTFRFDEKGSFTSPKKEDVEIDF
jgi:LEA14-like dessication related protein